jgi:hypothetical protein
VQQIVFQDYVDAVTAPSERLESIESSLRDAVAGWRRRPLVEALQALRGVQLVVAATLAAEIGQIDRFDYGGLGRLDSHRAGISQGRCWGVGFDFPGSIRIGSSAVELVGRRPGRSHTQMS